MTESSESVADVRIRSWYHIFVDSGAKGPAVGKDAAPRRIRTTANDRKPKKIGKFDKKVPKFRELNLTIWGCPPTQCLGVAHPNPQFWGVPPKRYQILPKGTKKYQKVPPNGTK
jgi:hypothetical protein